MSATATNHCHNGELSKLREKLAKERDCRIWRMEKMMMSCFCADIVLIAVFAQTSNQESFPNFKLWFRLFSLSNDTLDCCLLIAVRWFFIYIYQKFTIKYSHPDRYRDLSKQQTQSPLIRFVMLFWKYTFMHSGQSNITFRATDNPQKGTDLQPATHERKRKVMSCENITHKYQYFNQYSLTDFIYESSWLLFTTIICLLQTFIAVKMIFYSSSDRMHVVQFASTLCVILARAELYLLEKYLKYSLETYYKYENYELHEHWLKSTINPGAWCDICDQRQYIDCYRCDDCDFDVCLACWEKSKTARIAADNQLRNDRGDIYKRKYITPYQYARRLTAMHMEYKYSFLIAIASTLCLSLISLKMPEYEGKLINCIFEKEGNHGDQLQEFYHLVAIYISVLMVYLFFRFVSDYTFNKVSISVLSALENTVFANLLKQDLVYHQGTDAAHRNDILNESTKELFKPYEKLIHLVSKHGIDGIAGLILCYVLSWKLTLICISTIAPLGYIMDTFQWWYWKNFNKTWALQRDKNVVSYEAFTNIKTIRVFAKENLFIQNYRNVENEINLRNRKGTAFESIYRTVESWYEFLCVLLITWSAGMIVFHGDTGHAHEAGFTLGSLITFKLYWNKWKEFLSQFNGIYRRMKEGCAHAQYVFATLEFEPSIEPQTSIKHSMKTDDFGDIEFRNVGYYYQMAPNKQILKDVSFAIPKNKITAIVGKSGAGKSTIINLLLRLYDVRQGAILMNGRDIREMDVYWWRNRISVVTQDTQLFNKHIADNIGFGCNDQEYDVDELESVCKLANAHDFIMKLEDQYWTRCGAQGVRLSGGQKQRLSIARMLMSKSSLIILDEATSSLDSESETLVQQSLDKLMKCHTCTIVVIAHRLSTVFNADQIVVVDDGRIAQIGKHTELIQDTSGIYANLVNKQINLNLHQQKIENQISLIA